MIILLLLYQSQQLAMVTSDRANLAITPGSHDHDSSSLNICKRGLLLCDTIMF